MLPFSPLYTSAFLYLGTSVSLTLLQCFVRLHMAYPLKERAINRETRLGSQHPCNKPGLLRISDCITDWVRRRRMTRPCWLPGNSSPSSGRNLASELQEKSIRKDTLCCHLAFVFTYRHCICTHMPTHIHTDMCIIHVNTLHRKN